MEVPKVWPIALDYIGADSVLLDPAVPEIFYKHDGGTPNVLIFIDSPYVDSLSVNVFEVEYL